MKALITGGTGFVGRHLVRELVSRGAACRLLVRPRSQTDWLRDMDNIELWQGDITEPDSLKGIAEGVDYVYHLAAAGHVSAVSNKAFEKFIKVNVDGTRNLITACGGCNIKKFVHFSSTAAMGLIRKKLVEELVEPQPFTPYQKSKLESEKAALMLGAELGISVVIVRPCMIYGPGGKGEFFRMCRLMKKGFFPKVGLGKNLTPLVYVGDVVRGAIKAAEKGVGGEVYLLTSERSIELDRMRQLVLEAWGSRSFYPYVPVWFMLFAAWCFELLARISGKQPIVTRRNIASTVWDREFSIEKAKRQLGYCPQVGFREGIFETVEWFKSLQ